MKTEDAKVEVKAEIDIRNPDESTAQLGEDERGEAVVMQLPKSDTGAACSEEKDKVITSQKFQPSKEGVETVKAEEKMRSPMLGSEKPSINSESNAATGTFTQAHFQLPGLSSCK